MLCGRADQAMTCGWGMSGQLPFPAHHCDLRTMQEGEEAEVDFICFSGEPLSAIKLSKSLTPLSKPSDAELMAVGGQVKRRACPRLAPCR